NFVSVVHGLDVRHGGPRLRVSARLAREVSGVEFFECGVDVVDVEHDVRREPIVGVELGDAQHFDAEIPLAPVAVWGTDTGQSEALPADRNHGRRYVCQRVRQGSKIRDHDIAPFPDTDVHHAAAIIDKTVVGQYLG